MKEISQTSITQIMEPEVMIMKTITQVLAALFWMCAIISADYHGSGFRPFIALKQELLFLIKT